jgi:NTE family protein
MKNGSTADALETSPVHRKASSASDVGQIVVVFQGGGALGAYQAGVYQALHEAGIEPDWIIGTSIGAINAGLITGNEPQNRLSALEEFWQRMAHKSFLHAWPGWERMAQAMSNWQTISNGIPAFFEPNPLAFCGPHIPLGADNAGYYSTAPLQRTLLELIDFSRVNRCKPRLTVGAARVRTSQMQYFDSRETEIGVKHIMASGALPPAFPAIRIDGEAYWDGGVYSNTPIEAVLDDNPRRDSVIFGVNVWQPTGAEPQSIWQVMGRQKDIQYASRADSHIARQKQIHHLRHVIRQLAERLPQADRDGPELRELASWGCGTTMHVVRLLAPSLDSEDYLKDIDFTPDGIRARWEAGLADTRRMIERAPWEMEVDPMEGVVVHELSARTGAQIRENA